MVLRNHYPPLVDETMPSWMTWCAPLRNTHCAELLTCQAANDTLQWYC
jgi:hypothetical protein